MKRMKAYARLAIQFLVAYTMVFQQMPVAAFAQQAAAAGDTEAAQPAEQQEEGSPDNLTAPENADSVKADEIKQPSDTDSTTTNDKTVSPGWTQEDECEWRIDENGKLIIRPLGNGENGLLNLENNNESVLPWGTDFKSVEITGKVIAGEHACPFLFRDCDKLESANLSGLDTSRATSMFAMFQGCSSLKTIDLTGFDTSNVIGMTAMFSGCSSLKELDLSSFDTAKTIDMVVMFAGCTSLRTINLSGINTALVTDMTSMFSGCSSLETLDLSSFETPDNMGSAEGMFSGCNSLARLTLGEKTNLNNMGIDLGSSWKSSLDGQTYKGDELPANVAATYSRRSTEDQEDSEQWNQYGSCAWKIDSNGLLTIRPKDAGTKGKLGFEGTGLINYPWYDQKDSVKAIKIEGDIKAEQSIGGLFAGCSNLKSVDFGNFDTSQATDMSSMFSGCSSLSSLDLSQLNTSSVTSMNYMFGDCSSLKTLDLSPLDTSKVQDMGQIFCNCSSLTSLNLTSLNTSSATNMISMFKDCSSLASLNLSSFDTSSVTNMGYMFSGCSSLKSLDLDSFDTSNVTRMDYMFSGCTSLETLDLSSFDTSKVTKVANAFNQCNSLRCVAIPKNFKPKSRLPLKYKNVPITWETTDGITLPTNEDNAAGTYYAKARIDSSYFVVDTANCSYTGKAIEKKIEPSQDYSSLEKDKDYSIKYENNTNAGTATITIEGVGPLKGQLTYNFTIEKADPPYEVPTDLTAIYGQKLSNVKLPEGFSWENPDTSIDWHGKKEQTLTYTPKDTKNYNKVIGIKVEVTAATDAIALPSIEDLTYNGQKQVPSIDMPGVTVVSNEGGTSAGTYSVELALSDPSLDTWEDGTTENKIVKYKILPANIADAQAESIASCLLDNGKAEPKPKLTFSGKALAQDTDFTVTYENNTAPGTATLTIEGTGNFTGTKSIYFQIAKGSIANFGLVMKQKVFLYKGSAIEPTAWVFAGDNKTSLRRGVDYTISYENNDKVGTAKLIVAGKGEYAGTLEETFEIVNKIDLNQYCESMFLQEDAYLYTGEEIRPKAYVRLATESFNDAFGSGSTFRSEDAPREGRDFTVRYVNNTNPGTATVIVDGCGNYTGTMRQTFRIVRKSNLSLDDARAYLSFGGVVDEYAYAYTDSGDTCLFTGKPIKPNVAVRLQTGDDVSISLVQDVDYKVSYAHNTQAGTAEVTIRGANGIGGSKTLTFQIVNKLSVKDLNISEQDFEQLEYELKPGFGAAPRLKPSKSFIEGTDYSLSYADCDKIGMGKVTITGHGRYTDSTTVEIPIVEQPSHGQLSDCTFSKIEDQVYTGSPIYPKVTITDGNGNVLDASIDCNVEYKNNVNAGEATVTASRSDYLASYDGSASTTFKIKPADISNAVIADIKDANYTGKEVKPKLDVTFNGQKLVEGEDYTATYSDNRAVGTATVAISGTGNFTGTTSTTFKIVTPTVQYDYDLEEGKLTSTSFPNSGFVDVKNFRITLDHGGMVYLHTYLLGIDDMLCSLQDANGKILHSWVPKDGATYGAFALPAGTYYFQYFGSAEKNSFYNRASVMYTVRHHDEPLDTIYEKEPNNGAGEGHSIAADATPIEVGRFFAGSFYNPPIALDIDYFSFTLTKRSHICMNLVTEQSMMFALTDANGDILTNAQTGQSIVGKADKGRGGGLNFGMLEPGTYYVMISSTSTGAVGSPYYGMLSDVTSPVKTPAGLSRIAGNTRYSTMSSLVSAGNFASGGAAILASGTNYPDALAASSLAGDRNAPILLTDPNSLSEETKARLKRINPQILFIVGGEAAVSSKVEKNVEELLGESCTVIRLAGQTRYDTSLRVASLNSGRSDTVIIATGGNYADALSISPYAYASGSPVLLCDSKSGLSADAVAAIKKGGYTKAVIVGGTAAVPQKVESQLRSAGAGNITRLAGSTRYETSAKIADFELSSGLGFTMDGLLLATGRNFPDALAAGPLAGRGPSPLLLVDPGASYACSYLSGHRNEISRVTVVGGNAAISDSDARKIAQTLQIQVVR